MLAFWFRPWSVCGSFAFYNGLAGGVGSDGCPFVGGLAPTLGERGGVVYVGVGYITGLTIVYVGYFSNRL